MQKIKEEENKNRLLLKESKKQDSAMVRTWKKTYRLFFNKRLFTRKCSCRNHYASSSRSNVYPHIEVSDEATEAWYREAVNPKKRIFIICDTIYSFESIAACLEKTGVLSQGDKKDSWKERVYIFSFFDRRPIEEDDFLDNHNRKAHYRDLKNAFKIFPIIDYEKTNFVKQVSCVFCMLKYAHKQ